MRKHLLNRSFIFSLVVWTAVIGAAPSNALALPSASLSAVELSPAGRDAQIHRIMSVLSRPEAQVHLRLMGITQAELKDGLSRLDDAQLAQVSDKADSVKAGGDALGVVVVILVIVLLFVVIAKLMNKDIEIKDEKK